ncbi:PIG-L family deacetylase [Rhodanobacter sp. C03]|uniref:PIG-L deacetylase family protein n=1 Tax=Rhodanobacter sp. C03 TaxID=1945858 RepID=UPI000986EA02|nr:PIG-L family deacetylase [Rhodanobacter sp. C03]OOG56705.1 GlcNAc-PI de-N-acetylase [Rhodanobacter sp. C03]
MALTEVAARALPGWPPFSGKTRLLVVAPHPDDETIATGLLIQQVRAAGGEVRILLLTAGDNNPWPQRWLERRVRIRDADRQRWGQRRHAEMRQALQGLDLPESALEGMGWPDMGLTGCLLQPGSTAVPALAAAIGRFQPNLIALPALDDHHPDHSAAHVLVRLALAGQGEPPPLLTYLVHGHALDAGFIAIRGSLEQAASKQAALGAHASQMALSGQRMRRLAARPERYIEVVAPSSSSLPWQPPVWLQPWLRLSIVSPTGTQSWSWRDAPLQRDQHGSYRLAPTVQISGQPQFARLASTLPSPWIFDHWGWCELRPITHHDDAVLASIG